MQVNREKGQIEVDGVLCTAKVFTRHHAECKDAKRGGGWAGCDCRKSVLTYNGATRKQRVISAHTRSWEKAQQRAEEWLDQFDPTKREQARQEEAAVTVEKAVFSYLQDMIFRLGDNGTVSRARTLLGDVDAQGTVKRNGKLFDWLEKQLPRPAFISDFTAGHLNSWRGSWAYKSDLTAFASWGDVKTFFNFCASQGWLKSNPAAEIKRPKGPRGNRTATFSDKH